MRNARDAFLESPHRLEFEKMATSLALDVAAEYALLAYIEELPHESDPNSAWGAHCRMVGAREVLGVLRTLYQPVAKPTHLKLPSLKPPQ